MSRTWHALAAIGSALIMILAAPAARASETVLEVGVRVGYIVGLGWTAGPAASVGVAGQPFEFLWRKGTALLVGLGVSGDVVVGEGAQVSFRLHAGPEVGAVKACPALAAKLAGGLQWLFQHGAPARVAFEGGASFLGSVGDTSTMRTNPLFLGVAYRYAEPLDGEGAHEIGLEALRLSTVPFDPSVLSFLGFCGSLGGGPSRPLG